MLILFNCTGRDQRPKRRSRAWSGAPSHPFGIKNRIWNAKCSSIARPKWSSCGQISLWCIKEISNLCMTYTGLGVNCTCHFRRSGRKNILMISDKCNRTFLCGVMLSFSNWISSRLLQSMTRKSGSSTWKMTKIGKLLEHARSWIAVSNYIKWPMMN